MPRRLRRTGSAPQRDSTRQQRELGHGRRCVDRRTARGEGSWLLIGRPGVGSTTTGEDGASVDTRHGGRVRSGDDTRKRKQLTGETGRSVIEEEVARWRLSLLGQTWGGRAGPTRWRGPKPQRIERKGSGPTHEEEKQAG